MNELPTIRAHRIAPVYSHPFKPYQYNGTHYEADDKPKTRPDAPVCEEEGCAEKAHAVGLCPRHYYRYRVAVRKDPSLRRERVRLGFSPDKCGTSAGHQRHLYYKQEPCQPCKTAKTRYRAERRAEEKLNKESE